MLRVLVLEPRLGATVAVLVELPAMLAVSWLVCGWTVRRFAVPARWRPRVIMGAVALILLLGAETVLGLAAFGRTVAEQLASYRSFPGAAGLAAQLAFALMPLVRR